MSAEAYFGHEFFQRWDGYRSLGSVCPCCGTVLSNKWDRKHESTPEALISKIDELLRELQGDGCES